MTQTDWIGFSILHDLNLFFSGILFLLEIRSLQILGMVSLAIRNHRILESKMYCVSRTSELKGGV